MYGWSDFYKHSMYGISNCKEQQQYDADLICLVSDSDDYFKFNPDYYIGYSSESQWDDDFLKNGIDFDENIYGLLIQTNSVEFKLGNYSPRFGPFLSSNLLLSGQYPAFSNFHLKIYFKNLHFVHPFKNIQ